jgi:uroporphyrinogen-III synthase
MSKTDTGAKAVTPILLLKTKSTPNDGYEEQFSSMKDGPSFEPTFVPVLEHRFLEEGLSVVRDLLQQKRFGKYHGVKYGGLIFTSQRAVEAFAKLVKEGKGSRHPGALKFGPSDSFSSQMTKGGPTCRMSQYIQLVRLHHKL